MFKYFYLFSQDFLNLDKSSPDLLKEATASHVDHHSTFIPDSTNRGTERDAHTIGRFFLCLGPHPKRDGTSLVPNLGS